MSRIEINPPLSESIESLFYEYYPQENIEEDGETTNSPEDEVSAPRPLHFVDQYELLPEDARASLQKKISKSLPKEAASIYKSALEVLKEINVNYPCALEIGLAFYALKGESQLDHLGELFNFLENWKHPSFEAQGGVAAGVYDWMLDQSAQLFVSINDKKSISKVIKAENLSARWLKLLEIVPESNSSPTFNSVFSSRGYQILRELRVENLSRANVPQAYQSRLEYVISSLKREYKNNDPIHEELIEILSRHLVKLEIKRGTQGEVMSDADLRALARELKRQNENLFLLSATLEEKKINKSYINRLTRRSGGGFVSLSLEILHEFQKRKMPLNFLRTILISSLKSSDPLPWAQKMMAAWQIAYDTVMAQENEELKKIVLSISAICMNASDGQSKAEEVMSRWKLAYQIVRSQNNKELKKIASSIAHIAMASSDPEKKAGEIMTRWKGAYDAVRRQKNKELRKIAPSIAIACIGTRDFQKKATEMMTRWKEAYDAIMIHKQEALKEIAASLAAIAMLAVDSKKHVEELIERWNLAYFLVMNQDNEDLKLIAPSIALLAVRSKDAEKKAQELMLRWKLAYSSVIRTKNSDFINFAPTISNIAMQSKNSVAHAKVLMERYQEIIQFIDSLENGERYNSIKISVAQNGINRKNWKNFVEVSLKHFERKGEILSFRMKKNHGDELKIDFQDKEISFPKKFFQSSLKRKVLLGQTRPHKFVASPRARC